jgi:hypothetical protein
MSLGTGLRSPERAPESLSGSVVLRRAGDWVWVLVADLCGSWVGDNWVLEEAWSLGDRVLGFSGELEVASPSVR